jgi:hypothetical protein
MTTRIDMPKKYDILKYWAEKLINEYNKYWLDAYFDEINHNKLEKKYITSICFACGTTDTQTERCHILPLSKKGNNKIDNLHLLCKECHIESEYLNELNINYYQWFNSKQPNNSGSLNRRLNLSKLYNI